MLFVFCVSAVFCLCFSGNGPVVLACCAPGGGPPAGAEKEKFCLDNILLSALVCLLSSGASSSLSLLGLCGSSQDCTIISPSAGFTRTHSAVSVGLAVSALPSCNRTQLRTHNTPRLHIHSPTPARAVCGLSLRFGVFVWFLSISLHFAFAFAFAFARAYSQSTTHYYYNNNTNIGDGELCVKPARENDVRSAQDSETPLHTRLRRVLGRGVGLRRWTSVWDRSLFLELSAVKSARRVTTTTTTTTTNNKIRTSMRKSTRNLITTRASTPRCVL